MFSNDQYFKRHKPVKGELIRDFIQSKDVRHVYDVGCNRGDISYPLLKDGYHVKGVDGGDVNPPKDYTFEKVNLMEDNPIYFNDCTLFLSVWHHLQNKDYELADRIFYQLLLRTRYLIFDTGNKTESKRSSYPWYKSLKWDTEKEIFDHFGVPYDVIGQWEVAGGTRNVVVFNDPKFEVLGEYRRFPGTDSCYKGLVSKDTKGVHDKKFFKLKLGNRTFFAKDYKQEELENIKWAHETFPEVNLIPFYGVSEYGLIWEWVDDLEYKGKVREIEPYLDLPLRDIDIIEVNGIKKYIDFEK